MVVKKKATKKTTKKGAKPKTKVVYRTRTVYRKAPKEKSPLGDVARTTSTMIGGVLIPATLGIGVASALGHTLKDM